MTPKVRSVCALMLTLAACEFSTSDEDGGARVGLGPNGRGSPGADDASTGSDAGLSTGVGPATAAARDAAPPTTPTPMTSGDAATAVASDAGTPSVVGTGPGTVAAAACGAAGGLGSFKPSNLPGDLALKPNKTIQISHSVNIDTDTLAFSGVWAEEGAPLQLVSTPDGELAVLYVESFTTTTSGSITITGQRPFVLLAAKTIEHAGTITTIASVANGYAAGGAPGVTAPERRGFGPGGGAPGNAMLAASGGSYCGLGGVPTGSTATPAPAYGTPTLTPLLGGSSGGSATGRSNVAGGAIQLVAGQSLTIKETGTVNAPGFGSPSGAGGSSGGAILLEAPEVTVLGVVAANGASGGGGIWEGTTGTITNTPAAPHDAPVGVGSAGASINGGSGADMRSAGGGGVGRIRLNGACALKLGANALLTPNKGTPCYSEGSLLAR